MRKDDLINELKTIITHYKTDKTILVAIDGVDTSGKTYLADVLGRVITERPVVRVSIDGFHNPESKRTARGLLCPIGYYSDSFNYEYFTEHVLLRVKNGHSSVVPQIFNYRVDAELDAEPVSFPPNAVILCDGVFLLRKELFEYWDLTIFLDVSFDTVLNRAKVRDLDYFLDMKYLLEKYEKRYIPGQKIYFQTESPHKKADIVIDNNDFENPEWIRKLSDV